MEKRLRPLIRDGAHQHRSVGKLRRIVIQKFADGVGDELLLVPLDYERDAEGNAERTESENQRGKRM